MFLVGYARIVLAILSFYFMPTDYIVATIMYTYSASYWMNSTEMRHGILINVRLQGFLLF